jgi:hypothetical protein
MDRLLAVLVLALGVLVVPADAPAYAQDAPPAQSEPVAAENSADSAPSYDDSETDTPIQYEDDSEDAAGWSAGGVWRWFVRLFSFAKMFGLTGGLGLFAVISSVFVAGMVAFGHGMIAVFNVLDRLTTPTTPAVRDRMDAVLTRGQRARN